MTLSLSDLVFLIKYLKMTTPIDEPKSIQEFDYEIVIENIRQSTFHMDDKEAKEIINRYISAYPMLLNVHDREWYHKYC